MVKKSKKRKATCLQNMKLRPLTMKLRPKTGILHPKYKKSHWSLRKMDSPGKTSLIFMVPKMRVPLLQAYPVEMSLLTM